MSGVVEAIGTNSAGGRKVSNATNSWCKNLSIDEKLGAEGKVLMTRAIGLRNDARPIIASGASVLDLYGEITET